MWYSVLTLLAIALALLVILMATSLLVHRVFLTGGAGARLTARRAGPTLLAWSAEGAIEVMAVALRSLPPRVARMQLATLAATQLPSETAAALGALVRDTDWARDAAAATRSRLWTRRLEAARLLPALGTPGDVATLRRLLRDRHVAVRAAATAAIPRLADDELVADVVRALPSQPESLRRLQAQTVRSHWQSAERALVACLASASPDDAAVPNVETSAAAPSPAALAAWVAAAVTLATPAALAACQPHHRHPAPNVRVEVARALGTTYSPEALATLVTHLVDPADDVRAESARAIASYGALATEAVPLLAALLGDRAWTVRYHSALALALLGETGRRALENARSGPDRFARDMASLVAGLSEGAVLELADA